MAIKAAAEVTITDETDILSLVTWYALTASATPPSKPTTTKTSDAVPSPWTTNEPSFDPSQGTKYLYTVIQTRWKDGSCTWDNDVQLSSAYEQAKQAWNKANAAKDAADAATEAAANAATRSQRIYYRKSTSGAPAAPGTASSAWVTNGNADSSWTKYNAWSTRVPPIADSKAEGADKYLYLYTCEQREMADGTLAYTTVLLDDSATIIDGGNIITGSVAANKIVGHSISADQLTVGVNNSIANGAKTATDYIAIDPTDGIRIADANPGSASTYQRQTSTATEFVVGGERTAQFGGSGAIIGKDDELQLKLTPGAMSLENDTDDEVFRVAEDEQTVMTRTEDLVTYTASSEVTTAVHTVSDSLTASGAAVVTYNTATNSYTLDADYVTATVTEGTGVSASLTAEGVDYIASLIDDEDNPETGTLSVEYPAYHYEAAKLDMDGSIIVTGEGRVIQVLNEGWSSANSTDAFFIARNEVTGKELRIGVGGGGQNRGIYDPQVSRWLIYSDGNGRVKANADAVISRGTRSDRLGAAAPSSNYYHGDLQTLDAKGDIVFYSQSALTTARDLYRSFVCQRKSSNGKTTYKNGFYLHVDNSGDPSVSFTSGAPAAWRSGLGLGSLATKSSVAASDITSGSIAAARLENAGKYVSGTKSYTISSGNGTASVAVSMSVPSGYAIRGVTRISAGVNAACIYGWTWSGSTVTVSVRNLNSSGWSDSKTMTVGVICMPS